MPPLPDENELVTAAVAGDRLALERLLLLHAMRLAQYLQPRVPTELQGVIDAEDIMQQTFLQVYRDIGSFQPRGEGSFFAWIRGIADNRLVDCWRQHKRRKRGGDHQKKEFAPDPDYSKVMDLLDVLPAANGTPSQSVARREAVQAIQNGINALPDDQREAIRRYCIEGLTLEETAAAMGKTVGAIRALVYRGKCALQARIDRSANG